MKKLLLIAILMLALVFTAVACTGGEEPADTTIAEDTTVETPTEAPTAEPEDPTEPTETTAEPEETTEEPEETTEEPEETTEEPEVTTEEETTEEVTTADPADPVWIIDADGLAAMTNANAATVEKNEAGYASFTATGGDPWFLVTGNIGAMPEYMVMSYRTNTAQTGEFFIGNGAGPEGGKSFVYEYNSNEQWNLLVFHLPTVASYMTDNTVGHIRFDFYTGDAEEGAFLEVEYIAFFNTAEYAEAYYFAKHPAYVEKEAAGMVAHSFDSFFVNDNMYFPEDGAAGDKLTAQNNTVALSIDEAHDSISLRGWIGFNQAIDSFGYYIDNPYAQVFGEFKQDTEAGVLDAGGENASRFKIDVPTADLEFGIYTIGYLVKLADGTVVRLREEITLVLLPENIALNKPTDATSKQDHPSENLDAANVVDGNESTRWGANPGEAAELVVDLGIVSDLTRIEVVFENAMANYTIEISEDGETYVTVYTGAAADFAYEPFTVTVDGEASARYVKVAIVGGGNYFSIYEMYVYGHADLPTNVSVGKTASATSTQYHPSENLGAANVVDGNESTRWGANPGEAAELVVDLGAVCDLTKIEVIFENAMADYTIEISEDGETYVTVYTGAAADFAYEPFSVTVEGEASARYVKVAIVGGGNYFSIYEMCVYGYAGPTNVSVGKTASATSTQYHPSENLDAANVVDGNESTRWGANPGEAAELVVDLGVVCDLTKIEVIFENAMADYTIEISEDGETYVTAYTGAAADFAYEPFSVTVEGEASARYIKVAIVGGGNYFSIWELIAMGVVA